MTDEDSARKAPPKWIGPATEYGPLVLFLVAYLLDDLMTATKVVVAATLVAVALSVVLTRKLPWMPIVTAAIVAVFGGLTILLDDEIFIKMKPTIVQALFAAVLLGALAFGRLPLKKVMGGGLVLPDHAWRTLTVRFGVFFIAMAALNELVWRTQSTDLWVTFKVGGILGLTFLFVMAQIPFISRHTEDAEADGSGRDAQ
ncbi:MAG: septation protein A [Marivibrio sp.]|uniref:septation protein A n=1 Tax=Marivibrio sp. TaxID=2039719 RepID=UPI0032ECF500